MLIAFFNIRNSNHKHTCVEHIPNINFVFYSVKSDALTILQECPYNVVVTMGAHHLQQFYFMKSFIKRWLPCPWGVWWKPIFYPFLQKKKRGMKMGCPAPFAKLFRKIDSFKWWLPKVKKSIRKGMLELNCWMSVVFTWEDEFFVFWLYNRGPTFWLKRLF